MSDVDTNGGKRRRRNKRWPTALKREIVAATYLPGSSVSVVARQYDVNANQVFRWRRLAENSNSPTPASSSASGLVPVTITPEPEPAREGATRPTPTHSDAIEIEVGGDCRVRVGSSFDGRALKRVLDVLRKR
jgi:transposase